MPPLSCPSAPQGVEAQPPTAGQGPCCITLWPAPCCMTTKPCVIGDSPLGMCPGPCIGPQGKPQSGICIIPPRTSPGAVGIAKAFRLAAGSPPPAPSTMGTPALGTDLIELQERPPKGVSEPQLLPHPGSCGMPRGMGWHCSDSMGTYWPAIGVPQGLASGVEGAVGGRELNSGSSGISPQPAAHWPRALGCCPKFETGDASGDSDARLWHGLLAGLRALRPQPPGPRPRSPAPGRSRP